MKNKLEKKYARIVGVQKLMGVGLISTTVAATLLVPGGIGVGIITIPASLGLLAAPVPFIECETTYEFWKEQKDKGLD